MDIITEQMMINFLKSHNWHLTYGDTRWMKDDVYDLMANLPLKVAFKQAAVETDWEELIQTFTQKEIEFIQEMKL